MCCNGTWSSSTSTCDTTGLNAGYDELNRPRKRTYNDANTPPVTWVWDTARTGYLTSVSNSASTTAFTYFVNGWVQTSAQTPAGASPFNFSYVYHPSGALAKMIYPSLREVSYTLDAAGRIASIAPVGGSTAYWTGVQYAPQGAPRQVTLGNGLIERWGFNTARQQPWEVKLGTSTSEASHLRLQFAYCLNNFTDGSCDLNNGNILAQWNYTNNHIEHYTDDPLNRLSSATDYAASPNGWSQSYGFDRFGNRWVSAYGTLSLDPRTPDSSSDINTDNNRLTGSNYVYDLAGNQTTYGGWALSYDAENRLKTSQPSAGTLTTYAYDGDGRRVKKTVGSTNTWFIYDASGQLAAEYGGTAPPETGTHYPTTDHLGSTRLVTRQNNTVVSRHDYLPFGEEIPVNYGGRTTAMGYQANPALTQRFTGKERDTETGLDYFGARYLSSVQGRWSSPDAPFADQHLADPQSWNLYAYVQNRPLTSADRDGKATVAAVAWAIAEITGNVYDVYDTASTVLDPKASHRDKVLSIGGLAAGVILPGAGYGKGAKVLATKVDDAIAAAGAARRAATLGAQINRIEAKMSNLMRALDEKHIQAAIRESRGEIVKINPRDGAPYDHVTEVREAYQGLQNQADRIKEMLSSGDLTQKARAAPEQMLRQAKEKLQEVSESGVLQ